MKRDELIEIYIRTLNDIIVEVDVHTSGRKNKFPNKFYLKYIMRILFYGEHWNTFSCDECDRSTIRKKYYRWVNLNIFYKAYEKLRKKYFRTRTFKRLFIDSTVIQNKNCSDEKVTYGGHKLKGKKQTKISTICDSNGVILSHSVDNPKPHDNQYVRPLIKNLSNDINFKKHTTIAGDKGYISKQKIFYKNDDRLKLVTPKKKNQKRQIRCPKIKKILSERYKVEQSYAHLKRSYKRLDTLEDRRMRNYENFLLMGITCQIIKQIYKSTTTD